MVGLKNGHIRKNLTQKVVNPRDIAGERTKKKKKKNDSETKRNAYIFVHSSVASCKKKKAVYIVIMMMVLKCIKGLCFFVFLFPPLRCLLKQQCQQLWQMLHCISPAKVCRASSSLVCLQTRYLLFVSGGLDSSTVDAPLSVEVCHRATLENDQYGTWWACEVFFFFFFVAFTVYTIKAAREMNDAVFSSSCLQP